MIFALRNYRAEDFETLLAIDQSCFTPEIAYSAFELKTYIKRKGSFTLVAEATEPQNSEQSGQAGTAKAGTIVGFIVAEHARRVGHVVTIDVRAEARRHRVGSALLHAAEERLCGLQCHHARLETAVDNISALFFYKRHGYHVIKTVPRYYSNGVDALLLEKDLLSPSPPR